MRDVLRMSATRPDTTYVAYHEFIIMSLFHCSIQALIGWLEFNVPFQHIYGYIRYERSGDES